MSQLRFYQAAQGLCLRIRDIDTQGRGAVAHIGGALGRLRPVLAAGDASGSPGWRLALALSTATTEWLEDPEDQDLRDAIVSLATSLESRVTHASAQVLRAI